MPAVALPVLAVWGTCRPSDGGREVRADHGGPRLVEEINRGWSELAVEYCLFGPDREFLLSLPGAPYPDEEYFRSRWVRVRLLDVWDLAGAGAESGVPGSVAGKPEFLMLALDGTVTVQALTLGSGVSVFAVPRPDQVPGVRAYLQHAAYPNWPNDARERAEARAWLDHEQASS